MGDGRGWLKHETNHNIDEGHNHNAQPRQRDMDGISPLINLVMRDQFSGEGDHVLWRRRVLPAEHHSFIFPCYNPSYRSGGGYFDPYDGWRREEAYWEGSRFCHLT